MHCCSEAEASARASVTEASGGVLVCELVRFSLLCFWRGQRGWDFRGIAVLQCGKFGSRSFGPSTTVLDRNCAAPRSSTSRCRLPPRARLRCSRVGFAAAGTARARRTRVWGISARLAASRRPRRRQARARFASFSHRCRISSAAAVAGRAPRGARLHSLPHLS